jgi:hypothetical protein
MIEMTIATGWLIFVGGMVVGAMLLYVILLILDRNK